MKRHADGAFAHAHAHADVPGTLPLDGDSFHDAPLPLGQTGQHLSRIDSASLFSRRRCGERVGMVVDIDMIGEAAAAQMVDQLVARDRAQPRLERLCLIPRVALQMHGQQSLLNDVLAICARPAGCRQSAQRHGAQPRSDEDQQAAIRLVIPVPGCPHERGEIFRIRQRAHSIHVFVLKDPNITDHLHKKEIDAPVTTAHECANDLLRADIGSSAQEDLPMINRTTTAALAAAVAAAALMSSGANAQAPATDKERCYGISMAGKNDCAATGNNSCSGQSKADYDAKAWKYVAKGSCATMEVTLKDGMKRMGTLAPM